jgi:hypothetical protein
MTFSADVTLPDFRSICIMQAARPCDVLIDNERWVDENREYLNPDDPDAKHADAVTVSCVQVLGQILESIPENHMSERNAESLGNLAYIAINHSSPQVRSRCLEMLEIWNARCKKWRDFVAWIHYFGAGVAVVMGVGAVLHTIMVVRRRIFV